MLRSYGIGLSPSLVVKKMLGCYGIGFVTQARNDWLFDKNIGIKLLGAGATFDWAFFDNWNRRKVLQRPSKVVMFDSDLVRRDTAIVED